jgi:hypothetical protein
MVARFGELASFDEMETLGIAVRQTTITVNMYSLEVGDGYAGADQ